MNRPAGSNCREKAASEQSWKSGDVAAIGAKAASTIWRLLKHIGARARFTERLLSPDSKADLQNPSITDDPGHSSQVRYCVGRAPNRRNITSYGRRQRSNKAVVV